MPGGDEWGPWVDHDGKGCPIEGFAAQWRFEDDTFISVGVVDINGNVLIDPRTVQGIARDGPSWHRGSQCLQVVAYRIRKPKGLILLENLLRELPAPPDIPTSYEEVAKC